MGALARPLVIGHRGYPLRYPENTIASFLGAIFYGADGIELDVWLSGDGVPVVIHDRDTKRVSGISYDVKKTSVSELRKAYLGMGQVIPTLEEVLKAIPGDKLMLIEIKDVDAVEPVIELARRFGREQSSVIISFLTEALERARSLSPTVRIGLNIDGLDKVMWAMKRGAEIGLYSVNPPLEGIKMLGPIAKSYIRQARDRGARIFVWTVNDPRDAAELSEIADGIITDNVEAILVALGKRG